MRAAISWLDVKLGVRMLVKHPGLTLVGGLGLAVGVAVSAAFFSSTAALVYPRLPLDEGDRIVALENRDLAVGDEERRALHDFVAWRGELRRVRELGAFRFVDRNLVVAGEGAPEPVEVAEMTASGFRVARVPPLLGRWLVDEDERAGAPPVVVIGHDVWRSRFGADPAVVGRDVRLGGVAHTVVGVMPEGFAFPMSQGWWTALRTDPSGFGRRAGPEIFVFGRLAPGATMAEAQAELDATGRRAAAAWPDTHARLRPTVMPYTHSLTDMQGGVPFWSLAQMQLMTSLLLLVVALNVAVLVYARVAMRRTEIAVRCALGASRRRIVAQLFAEALVLSLGAAAAGFALAQYAVRLGMRLFYVSELDGARPPFWLDYGLRPSAVLFTLGLAVLAAVIVGVLPALQVTGRLRSRLGELGGGGGVRLGRTWTALIVAQVAVSVAVLPAAVSLGWFAVRAAATRPVFPAERFLSTRVEGDADSAPAGAAARSADRLEELMRRLAADPDVAGVTYRAQLPGRDGKVQVEGVPAPAESPSGHGVGSYGIHPGYLDVFGARLLAGRRFGPADLGDEAAAVIVSEAFVRRVLGGGDALGRRIRHGVPGEAAEAGGAEAGRWYEVVGVVADLETNPVDPELVQPRLYYPVAPGRVQAVSLAVRLRGSTPADFAARLRGIAAGVDPSLRLGPVTSMAEGNLVDRVSSRGIGVAVVLVLLSVFLLSAAGIYALMSFAVTQRRREIGIRTALGAHPLQVLRSVFARAAWQLALGLAAGVAFAILLEGLTDGGLMEGRGAAILPALATAMATVGLLAALGPARRGLRIQPTEALRADG